MSRTRKWQYPSKKTCLKCKNHHRGKKCTLRCECNLKLDEYHEACCTYQTWKQGHNHPEDATVCPQFDEDTTPHHRHHANWRRKYHKHHNCVEKLRWDWNNLYRDRLIEKLRDADDAEEAIECMTTRFCDDWYLPLNEFCDDWDDLDYWMKAADDVEAEEAWNSIGSLIDDLKWLNMASKEPKYVLKADIELAKKAVNIIAGKER